MPIFLRPHRKVQPYGTIAVLLYQQFIIFSFLHFYFFPPAIDAFLKLSSEY